MEHQHTIHQRPESNGLAIAALVLGIIGVVLNFIIIIPYFLSILAIIFGSVGLKKTYGRGMAIAGIILGSVGLLMKICFWILIFMLGSMSDY
ncbi:Sec-independent protein secretion pathway component TatC [Sporosarcina luteola]|nr:Sec-independent protein secretion pathway component TatC [Sporosarcina luteola]